MTMNQFIKRDKKVVISFFSLLIIATTFTFSSCKKDKEKEPDVRDHLISGAWYLHSTSFTTTNPCSRKSYFRFSADGTIISQSFDMSEEVCTDYGQSTGTYTLTDNKYLTVNGSSMSWAVEIISISQETMVFEASSEGETQRLFFDKIEG
jgi:hypothetical protein